MRQSQIRSSRVEIKRKQVQLFCGRFTSTQDGAPRPDLLTDVMIKEILEIRKRFEQGINWQLVDCK